MSLQFLGSADRCDELGRKAASLDALMKGGFRVPAGFAISTEYVLSSESRIEILDAIKKIGGFPVAVRSSGGLEDLENASFAGQYETILNVDGWEQLRDAVDICRRSINNQNALEYSRHKGLTNEDKKCRC